MPNGFVSKGVGDYYAVTHGGQLMEYTMKRKDVSEATCF